MPLRTCIVAFTDHEGIHHQTEVLAESLYEAVALAASAFREHDCLPGPGARMEVEVRGPSVTHAVTMRKLWEWVDRPFLPCRREPRTPVSAS